MSSQLKIVVERLLVVLAQVVKQLVKFVRLQHLKRGYLRDLRVDLLAVVW